MTTTNTTHLSRILGAQLIDGPAKVRELLEIVDGDLAYDWETDMGDHIELPELIANAVEAYSDAGRHIPNMLAGDLYDYIDPRIEDGLLVPLYE